MDCTILDNVSRIWQRNSAASIGQGRVKLEILNKNHVLFPTSAQELQYKSYLPLHIRTEMISEKNEVPPN